MPARRALVTARRLSHPSYRPHPRVDVQIADGIAVLALDDGKVNAVSASAIGALVAALDRVQADERVGALVITGRPGQFCTGFDLDTLIVGGKRRDELVRDGWNLLGRRITLPLPVVTACTGNAVALGAALLLTGVRLGADGEFKIGFNEAAIGARLYRPPDALGAGFLHRVVAASELRDAAVADARTLRDRPTFRDDKRAHRAARRTDATPARRGPHPHRAHRRMKRMPSTSTQTALPCAAPRPAGRRRRRRTASRA